jgi:hypothetical protein
MLERCRFCTDDKKTPVLHSFVEHELLCEKEYPDTPVFEDLGAKK